MYQSLCRRLADRILAPSLIAAAVIGSSGFGWEQPSSLNAGLHADAKDWPWWRGADRNGTADPNQKPPLQFSDTENVLWKTDVPGRGYGSPAVVGSRVFLATADEVSGAQSLLCYDRATGKQVWQTVVHASGGMRKNNKSTAASSSPACDGQLVFICFPNNDALITTAVDLNGIVVWQQKISNYVEHQGYGASPTLYRDMVLVSSDNKGGGAVAALNRKTGEFVWRRERPALPNYTTPTVLHVAGKDQLIMVGCDKVVSYDPLTGSTNWETDGATTECVTSTVTDGKLVYTSGGYPKNHMSAVAADGSTKKVWENDNRLYVPSLLIRDGYLYAVLDAGIAMCWNAATGEEQWKGRLCGNISSSPVLVGDKVFAASEDGKFFVFSARPDKFEKLAENRLGDLAMATPAICNSQIFHRVAFTGEDGKMHERLYCLQAK
ncbi:MAG: PQQ-binding-like beta-propeller repeat protein [Pirellulales bacterium]